MTDAKPLVPGDPGGPGKWHASYIGATDSYSCFTFYRLGADKLRVVRGYLFSPKSGEGAVISRVGMRHEEFDTVAEAKAWVECMVTATLNQVPHQQAT